jgi:hypothetical protein
MVNGNGSVPALVCHFPGCVAKMQPAQAYTPAIAAVRQVIGRPVTVADLAEHTLCKRHATAAREEKIPVFSYTGSARELERRAAERTNAGKFFQMYSALDRAGVRPRRP